MASPQGGSGSRQSCLAVLLAGMFAAMILFVLILVTGGAIFYVLPVIAGLGLFSWMHYLLWGRAMNERTAGEREEEQVRQQAERDGWPLPEPDRYERY